MGLFFMDVRQKRLMVYAVSGFVPLIIAYFTMLLGLDLYLSFGAALLVSMVCMFLVHRVTMNPLAKFELDGDPMLQTMDSLGVLNFYSLFVAPEDRIITAKVEGKDVKTSYSTTNIFESIFHKEKIPAWSDATHMHVMIPLADAYTHTFKSRGVPTLLYNRRTNSFWTKMGFSGIEDNMVLENNIAYLAYSTRTFEQTTRDYARSAVDKLWEKVNVPGMWVIIILLVLVVIFLFFQDDIMGFVNGVGGTISGVPTTVSTVPVEASGPI